MERLRAYFSVIRTHLARTHGWLLVLIIALLLSIVWVWATTAPSALVVPVAIDVPKGATVKEITQQLKDAGLIRSRAVTNTIIIVSGRDTKIVSGTYLFERRPSTFEVVRRVTRGDFGVETKEVRIPEGATTKQIGELFEQEFAYFDKDAFYQLTEGKEGYLFPDTYQFLETVKAYEVVAALEENFAKQTAALLPLMKASERTLEDVVIMASIIEREATADSRQAVGNILWKRIEIEMPLQVDATFVYSVGRGTFDLTKADLANEDNPYNTYTHKGLPPTAISNPGFESLKAAATKEDTDYLFFLTGHDGEMYYAETFEGHKRNRARYLN
ncbi:MAG: hypothetical protein RL150_345 [Candidatus Parcubacteria bacterium]|jgi:UPF0755 protein